MQEIIRVENIHKSFGDKDVLMGVNFIVLAGEILVIIGQSGSGKSVIFKHLIALLNPDKGAVLIGGENIHNLNEKQLNEKRKMFGVAFQMSALFDSMTIFDNVAFALKRQKNRLPDSKIKSLVLEKLELVGLNKIEHKKPADVSGGMQKRVAIARAIILNPQIILYDEPTTGLDSITASVIDDLIMKLNRELNITSIVVSHDMKSVFKIANRITMLYKGKMIKTGTVDDFKNSNDPVIKSFIEGKEIMLTGEK